MFVNETEQVSRYGNFRGVDYANDEFLKFVCIYLYIYMLNIFVALCNYLSYPILSLFRYWGWVGGFLEMFFKMNKGRS